MIPPKVTPLWKQPYERQLILKKRELVKKLRNTTRELNNLPWAKASLKTNEGTPSSVTHGYPASLVYVCMCVCVGGLNTDIDAIRLRAPASRHSSFPPPFDQRRGMLSDSGSPRSIAQHARQSTVRMAVAGCTVLV